MGEKVAVVKREENGEMEGNVGILAWEIVMNDDEVRIWSDDEEKGRGKIAGNCGQEGVKKIGWS
jgi:hypothetical protein